MTKSYINSRILCYYNREWIKPKPLLLLPPPLLVLDYIILIYNFFRSNEGDNSSLSSSVQYAYHFYIVFMLWGIIQVFLWYDIYLKSSHSMSSSSVFYFIFLFPWKRIPSIPNPCIFNLFNKSDENGFCIFKCGEIGWQQICISYVNEVGINFFYRSNKNI